MGSPDRLLNKAAQQKADKYLRELENRVDVTQDVLRDIFGESNFAREHQKLNERQLTRLNKYRA